MIKLVQDNPTIFAIVLTLAGMSECVVAQVADRVVVMYDGQIIEIGSVRQVLKDPQHPYTAHLLASIPGSQAVDADRHAIDWAEDAPIGSSTVLATSPDGRQVRKFSP